MSSVVKGVTSIFKGDDAPKEAAGIQARSAEAGIAEQRRQFDITQEQLAPFREAGLGALEQQQALLGLAGQPAQQEAFAAFAESPGQRFLRERQERALLRNASAIGGLGGGNVRTALQEQAAGIASTQLGDFQNRLAGLSGTGQSAATNVGQFGAQAAGNIANLQQAAGQARASGVLGAQQQSQALGGQLLGAGVGAGLGASGILGAGVGAGGGALLGLLSDIRFKRNIEKVGELDSGLGWYIWEWTDEGKAIAGKQAPVGVIAQEAMAKFPNAVTDVGGYLLVDYKELH